MVNKITTPPTTSELIGKVNDIIDDKQDTLVSGTNIKTINNTSILGSGNIDIQGGSSYTAGTGIDITNDVISVTSAISSGAALGATAVQPADLSTYVTTNTIQDITARKTFFGEKAIYFKQSTASDKLGFTLYNNNNSEVGALEFRPNTIDGRPILTLNSDRPSSTSYVGFRYCRGGVNILAPYSISYVSKNFFIPVTFTNGTTTVESTSTDGSVNISSLLPTVDQTYSSTSTNAQSGVAVASAISGKADDNEVVHIAGTETITGDKTFTGSLTIPAETLVAKQSTSGDEGGELQFEVGTNSVLQSTVKLDVYQNAFRVFGTDSNGVSYLAFNADIENHICSLGVTPTTSSNDTTVATTAFVKNVLSELYPVGSLYIGTQSTCPLATLISGSTWTLVATDKALWGGDGTNADTTIAAGLPNITARFGYTVSNTSPSGATRNTVRADGLITVHQYEGFETDFDASRSSSIYGNSTTVQPPAYRVNVWKRTA